jgi:hypothetical protein
MEKSAQDANLPEETNVDVLFLNSECIISEF